MFNGEIGNRNIFFTATLSSPNRKKPSPHGDFAGRYWPYAIKKTCKKTHFSADYAEGSRRSCRIRSRSAAEK